MLGKDCYYGYVTTWEGPPGWSTQQTDQPPLLVASVRALGTQGIGMYEILCTLVQGEIAPGDTVIFDNYAYTVVEWRPSFNMLVIDPGLVQVLADDTIGTIIHSV